MHMIKFNDIWEQKLFPLFIVRGWKYRRGGENIVTIFSPRGEDIVGVKISSHTGCHEAACGRAGQHNDCCAGLQYQPRQHRPYKWSISILPRSQFYKKQGILAFLTSCTAVCPHQCSRNDAWRQAPIPRSDALRRNICIFTKWLTLHHINVHNFF